MKRCFLVLLIFSIVSSNAFNQIIKGTVLDKKSRVPVDFAAVFFNGTFVGTNTDKNGCFELDISQNSSMPLTISALGYNSVTLTEYSVKNPITVLLETKVFGLKEVIVSGKASTWTRRINLEIFMREFLGSTLNSWSSEIVNKDDIIFYHNPGSDTLNAYSLKPVIIQNKSLGYIIYYYLDKFAYCNSNGYLLLTGNYIFKEDLTSNENQQQKYERRRKTAYLGSRMHFFRELWANNLDSAGFTVRDSANVKLRYENIVVITDSTVNEGKIKYLMYSGAISLAWYSSIPTSRIVMTKESVFFDDRGFFDPYGIRWEGDIAKQRVADLLPFEYSVSRVTDGTVINPN